MILMSQDITRKSIRVFMKEKIRTSTRLRDLERMIGTEYR